MRVIGIDPGSLATGYGIVEENAGRPAMVHYGVIRMPPEAPLEERLLHIHRSLAGLIEQHEPAAAAVEGVFVKRNAQSALKLGQARGAALLALAEANLAVTEYSPAEVKSALCGNGRAAKDQVQRMVGMVLGISKSLPADAADALAIAVCHLQKSRAMRRVVGAAR